MSGRVVHFEIPVEDQQRANGFYEGAFGWRLAPMPGMGYTLVTTGPSGATGPTEPGYVNGGMLRRTDESSAPVVTVEVDDIDAALARIAELGGSTVLGKQAVGDMGFSAYVTDSEGNVIGLWESGPG